MIRFAWVMLNIALATLVFGGVAIVAALLRRRGRVYFWCTQQWARAALWAAACPVLVEGLDEVDWSGPQVLVSNHVSGYDIFALAAVLPVPFSFVGKKELNRIPFFGLAWQAAGHISIDRSDRHRAIASLRRAGERIRRENGTVVIFPEGTRSRTRELQPFKKGAFQMALSAGLPVVPAVVRGSDEVQPGGMRVRPRPIHLRFGAAVPVTGLQPGQAEELVGLVRTRMERMLAEPPHGA